MLSERAALERRTFRFREIALGTRLADEASAKKAASNSTGGT